MKDARYSNIELVKVRTTDSVVQMYEYIPESEQDFKEVVGIYLNSYARKGAELARRIVSVNFALKELDIDTPMVSALSSQDEWAEAYWQLSLHDIVSLGYNTQIKTGLILFTKQSSPSKSLH